jgi:hypothetical protein
MSDGAKPELLYSQFWKQRAKLNRHIRAAQTAYYKATDPVYTTMDENYAAVILKHIDQLKGELAMLVSRYELQQRSKRGSS